MHAASFFAPALLTAMVTVGVAGRTSAECRVAGLSGAQESPSEGVSWWLGGQHPQRVAWRPRAGLLEYSDASSALLAVLGDAASSALTTDAPPTGRKNLTSKRLKMTSK